MPFLTKSQEVKNKYTPEGPYIRHFEFTYMQLTTNEDFDTALLLNTDTINSYEENHF